MRLLCAVGISLAVGMLLAFADDKKPEGNKTDRAERLKKIDSRFDKEWDDLKRRAMAAKDISERKGISEEARELCAITSQDVLKLAEEDPKDSTGFDAALFIVDKAGLFGPTKEIDAALNIIGSHHLENPKVKDLLPRIGGFGPSGQKFLLLVSEKSKNKESQGIAMFFLGMAKSEELDDEDDAKKMDELISRAKEYFNKAKELAPEAKIGQSTIGKEVAVQLESLQNVKNLAVGKPVPEVIGTDLAGKKVKLSSYKGKVVLVDIWATWCGPCRSMIPSERDMVKKLDKEKKPFKLLSISCDDEQDTLVKFIEMEGMPWDHWFDGAQGPVAKAFRVRAFPTLYLIDHTGVIRNKWIGVPDHDKLEKEVKDLVEAAVKANG